MLQQHTPRIIEPQEISREALEHMLGMKVSDMSLYHQVFTHKSCATDTRPSYERLEFIGDAVVNLVVARWLFDAWPRENEGFLTRLRTKLVSGACLSRLAQHLQLHRFVRMNDRAIHSGWQHNARIQEDTFESLIGAIYLAEGLIVARQFLITLYSTYIDFGELMCENNFKDVLMRWCQSQGLALPEYETVNVHSTAETKHVFEVRVTVQGVTGYGRGHTKKMAQQEAAKQTLVALRVPENF